MSPISFSTAPVAKLPAKPVTPGGGMAPTGMPSGARRSACARPTSARSCPRPAAAPAASAYTGKREASQPVIPNVPCHPESAHVILSASEGSHPAKEGRVCPAGARGAGRHSHIAALVLDPSPSLSLRATAHALRMTGTAALRTIEPILIGTLHQGGHRHLWHLSQRGVSRSRSSRRPIRWKAPPVPLLIPRRLLNARARRSWRSLYPCPWR